MESIAFGQLLDRELNGWNISKDVERCFGGGLEHTKDTLKSGVLDFLQLFEVTYLGFVLFVSNHAGVREHGKDARVVKEPVVVLVETTEGVGQENHAVGDGVSSFSHCFDVESIRQLLVEEYTKPAGKTGGRGEERERFVIKSAGKGRCGRSVLFPAEMHDVGFRGVDA